MFAKKTSCPNTTFAGHSLRYLWEHDASEAKDEGFAVSRLLHHSGHIQIMVNLTQTSIGCLPKSVFQICRRPEHLRGSGCVCKANALLSMISRQKHPYLLTLAQMPSSSSQAHPMEYRNSLKFPMTCTPISLSPIRTHVITSLSRIPTKCLTLCAAPARQVVLLMTHWFNECTLESDSITHYTEEHNIYTWIYAYIDAHTFKVKQKHVFVLKDIMKKLVHWHRWVHIHPI